MPSTNIKNLSVTQLLAMRGDIDKLLQSKRSELQAQLAQIGGDGYGVRKAGSVKGTKVPPKYRHPNRTHSSECRFMSGVARGSFPGL